MSRFLSILCSSIFILALSACEPSHSNRIVVGSKNFTESFVLGELIAQQIETHTHLKVERRFYLAGTYICQQAILSGRIDVYPEYTGTALTAILKQQASNDKADVYRRVKSQYEHRFGLTLGPCFRLQRHFCDGNSRRGRSAAEHPDVVAGSKVHVAMARRIWLRVYGAS